jgi:Fe-Mn family superoxide dismutase
VTEERTVFFACLHGAYGFNVGCAVAGVLRERGLDARFLRGGLSAWPGIGGARTRPNESRLVAA